MLQPWVHGPIFLLLGYGSMMLALMDARGSSQVLFEGKGCGFHEDALMGLAGHSVLPM